MVRLAPLALLFLLSGDAAAGAPPVDIAISRGAETKPLNIFDEIRDARERSAFREMWDAADPARQKDLALRFVEDYPRSILLREAYELAARAFVTLGDYASGLEWAKRSLRLMPENPFLLVMAGGVAVKLQELGFAETSARDALQYLLNADTPSPITPEQWPAARTRLRASAQLVLGRVAAARGRYKEAEQLLLLSLALNPADAEALYVLAIVRVALHDDEGAAPLFAFVMKGGGLLATGARANLQRIYERAPIRESKSLEAYGASLSWTPPPAPFPAPERSADSRYAGSAACKSCHRAEVERWQATGMAKMLRPYRAEDVIGDFSGRQIVSGGARGVTHEGRHYIEIRTSAVQPWQRYPVDYIIGSKWQQAYATSLPGGRVVVFPIQYSRLRSAWIDYWKIVDGPDSPRADISRFSEVPDGVVYQTTCAPCHTSQLRFGSRVDTAGTASFREGGINCEMCHGPSLAHIETMNGVSSAPVDLPTPVDFARLPAAQSVAICAQCHSQSAVHDVLPGGAANFSGGAPFYRTYAAHLPSDFSRAAFYRDGRYRATTFIVEAFSRSKCFRSGGATCASCHNPHPPDASTNPTSLTFGQDADEMCVQCHTTFRERPERHTRHAPGTEAGRCVSCHMPRIMDALLFPARSHQIDDVPDAAMTARFGADESPNACLSCHRDRDALWLQARMVERSLDR